MDRVKLVPFAGKYEAEVLKQAKIIAARDNLSTLITTITDSFHNETAFLFWCNDGFFILEPITYKQYNAVNVLLAYSNSIHGVLRYHSAVEELAQRINSSFIVGYTAHERVLKIYERVGFVVDGKDGNGLHFFVKDLR
ncbi:hypothetical protein [Vibrio sp. ER1A]|uniref:hypothetical protein n=1 Tax=Vibrio sp. ER1A TaxID=1517681 RepID=UPI0004DD3252|nr:hypothetical protein [Vibrio sp. ER1A]KFA99608.1 hypothetical protein HW45_02665 [Vibrio sp. ER1A]